MSCQGHYVLLHDQKIDLVTGRVLELAEFAVNLWFELVCTNVRFLLPECCRVGEMKSVYYH